MRRLGQAILVLLVVLALLGFLTRPGRVAFKTALLVPQVLPQVGIKPQAWFSRQPVRADIRYPVADGTGVADLYRVPGGGRRAGLVFFLGVNPAGRDDPRVVNLSQGLARAGFAVLVPWSDVMTQRRLDVDSPEALVWAYQHLSGQEFVDSKRVGLAGFCVGASIAVVAAEDSRINEQVSFVNDFGGYYDGRDFLAQIASRTSFQEGRQEPWVVGNLTREVFVAEMLSAVDDSEERTLLSGVFPEGGSISPQEVEALSASGRAVHDLLKGVSLEEARRLVGQLPPRAQAVFDRVSPSTHVERLKAPLLIMHDREDDAVPVEESRRFAEALRGRGDVTYTEFSFFQHVDPTRRVPIDTFVREAWKLYRHLFRVVSQAT